MGLSAILFGWRLWQHTVLASRIKLYALLFTVHCEHTLYTDVRFLLPVAVYYPVKLWFKFSCVDNKYVACSFNYLKLYLSGDYLYKSLYDYRSSYAREIYWEKWKVSSYRHLNFWHCPFPPQRLNRFTCDPQCGKPCFLASLPAWYPINFFPFS